MYEFHVSLSSPHAWASNPWSWLVVGRPTLFFYQSPTRGQRGCTVAQCSEAITALGNPVIWWGAVLGIAVLLFRWALRRDWRAGAVLAGLLAGYVPWLHYQQRTIFNFYAIAFTPFIVLSLTYLLGLMLGPAGAPPRRRRIGGYAAGGVVLLAVLVFWFFLPVYTAEVTPVSWWRDRVWLPSWN
jgi:dolichyl-phosphate-mannose--protein O-mannosyl transferase